MKNFLFSLIIAILFFNIAHAKSYKTGDIVVDEFIELKNTKLIFQESGKLFIEDLIVDMDLHIIFMLLLR